MARHSPSIHRPLLPKARLGAARDLAPLKKQILNFKLTVLSRQNEFLSGTGTVGKLRFSSFTFYARLACPTRFGTCKFEKGVARLSRNVPNSGSGSVISKYRIRDLDPGFHQNVGIYRMNTIKMVDC